MPFTRSDIRALVRASALLIGLIIGAGIFGVPFVVAKIGLVPGILYILVIGALLTITTLAYGEVVLRTKKKHGQIAFLAGHYLGKNVQRVATAAFLFGGFGAAVAYFIGLGDFFFALVGGAGTPTLWGLVLGAIIAAIIFLELRSRLQPYIIALLVVALLAIIFLSVPEIAVANFSGVHLSYFFLPFGVILFALGGLNAVPEVDDVLEDAGKKKLLKPAILIGTIFPIVFTAVFALVVVGVSGSYTSQEAIAGLSAFVGQRIVLVGTIMGLLSLSSAFLASGFVLRDFFHVDYKLPKFVALLIAVGVPAGVYVAQVATFVEVLSIVGSVLSGVLGMVIMWLWRVAKKKGDRKPEYALQIPSWLFWLIMAVYFFGIVYQFVVILLPTSI